MRDEYSVPSAIDTATPQGVAYHLMMLIAAAEKTKPDTREYWLTLYEQCLAVSYGNSAKDALSGKAQMMGNAILKSLV